MSSLKFDEKLYPSLAKYTKFVYLPSRRILGRDKQIKAVLASLVRPELCNVLLLAPAGSGKTALVQALSEKDKDRVYVEVDLAVMIDSDNAAEAMPRLIKSLFDEAEDFARDNEQELVLFIDEVHQIVQKSPAAVEALKPVLARSGERGLKLIVATTYEEYRQYLSPNQALIERLSRITIEPTDKKTTIAILKTMVEKYGITIDNSNRYILNDIYDLAERYIPSSVQPRKSIKLLDSLIGWCRLNKIEAPNRELLGQVMREATGMNVWLNVDASKIKDELNSKVFSQEAVIDGIVRRLQICIADLQDKTRPQASFIFAGSTGTGKSHPGSTLIPVDDYRGFIRISDIKVGDTIFDRLGNTDKVTEIFDRGELETWVVEVDGRSEHYGKDHIWTIVEDNEFANYTTHELYNRLQSGETDGFRLPPAGPIHRNVSHELALDPYVLGFFLRYGEITDADEISGQSMRERLNTEIKLDMTKLISSDALTRVSNLLGVSLTDDGKLKFNGLDKYLTYNFFAKRKGLAQFVNGFDNAIPYPYLRTTIENRKALFEGLTGGKLRLSNSKHKAADTIIELATSLGYRVTESDGFLVFSDEGAIITNIYPTGKLEAHRCIKVSNDEHLYRVGKNHVVTHNTETAKQLANILFGDSSGQHLVRMDMTEFSQSDRVDDFKNELAAKITDAGNAVVLIDEVEKGAPNCSRLLMGILDEGRLTDTNNRQVSFRNSYVILTTNAGSEIFKTIGAYDPSDTGNGKTMENYQELLKKALVDEGGGNKFPPELIGRVNAVVGFQPLSKETIKRIISAKLAKFKREVYAKHNVIIKVSDRLVEYIVSERSGLTSDSGGARYAVEVFTSEVVAEVANFINTYKNKYPAVLIDVDGEMRIESKTRVVGDAHVVVKADRNR